MVKIRSWRFYLLAAISAASFLSLLAIMFLTNPVKDVSYAVVFFAILLVLLLSLGFLWSYIRRGRVAAGSRYKIVVISVLAVVFLMFRSTGSLNWVDLVVLVLLILGLLFYGSRRT